MKKKTEFVPYAEQIKDPRWQKKRLEVLEANEFTCSACGDKENELHVHHPVYKKGAMIWEYEDYELCCLCSECHKAAHAIGDGIKQGFADLTNQDDVRHSARILGYIHGIDGPPRFQPEWKYFEDYQVGFVDANRTETYWTYRQLGK